MEISSKNSVCPGRDTIHVLSSCAIEEHHRYDITGIWVNLTYWQGEPRFENDHGLTL